MGNLPNDLPPLPVTVISGFLGAGKTTLVNQLLRTTPDRRIGVLVNDFGEISIDADLIRETRKDPQLFGESKGVISLTNGCICCSLRNDLTQQVMRIAESTTRPEHILIEASGISDPGAILQALLELERYQVVRLDGVIAMVDSAEKARLTGEAARLADRQVRAADLVVLGKTDLVPPAAVEALEQQLRPRTQGQIVRANHGRISPALLLGLEGPKERALERDPAARLGDDLPVKSDLFSTWLFRTERRFAFKSLVHALRALPDGVYRGKGFIHIVERPGDRVGLHLTGRRVQVRTVGRWGSNPRNELVFIGNPEAIRAETLEPILTPCLEPEPSGPG